MTRQRSAEETVHALAATGQVELVPPIKKERGSGMLDDQHNVTFGWQEIGLGKTKIDHTTNVRTSILLSPCLERGTVTEIRILMGTLDVLKTKASHYCVQIYDRVSNDMKQNLEVGIDLAGRRRDDERDDEREAGDVPSPMFRVGDRVTCSAPHPDQEEDEHPKTGYVLCSTFAPNTGGYVYDLKYNDGRSDHVPEFLLSAPDAGVGQGDAEWEDRSAFRLVSSHPIQKVRTGSSSAYGYSLDIPIEQNQYVGLSCIDGALDIYYNGIWPRSEPNVFRYAFTRGFTPGWNEEGHVEYHCVHADPSTWGFATTIRYDSVEAIMPILGGARPVCRRLSGGRGYPGGGSGGGSAYNRADVEDTTSSDEDDGMYRDWKGEDDWDEQD